MSVDTAVASPFVVARARVLDVSRVSPTFARVTFGGGLDELGDVGEVYDQRIKLVLPPAGGAVPDLAGADDWYGAWLAVPEAERGAMRTYSIRKLLVDDEGTRVVVDFVLHLAPGLTGPAARWAAAAVPGDEVLLVGPRRGRAEASGIEYAPGDARTVVLAGDETAAPAIARILEDADPSLRGVAFIEVPTAFDELPIAAPAGVSVRWLPRDGRPHGAALLPAVLDHLDNGATPGRIRDVETAEPLWETPSYSGLGEPLPTHSNHADSYFWIAGESAVVTTLRRHLVRDLHIDRAQVAFMGYWRKGVAMRG